MKSVRDAAARARRSQTAASCTAEARESSVVGPGRARSSRGADRRLVSPCRRVGRRNARGRRQHRSGTVSAADCAQKIPRSPRQGAGDANARRSRGLGHQPRSRHRVDRDAKPLEVVANVPAPNSDPREDQSGWPPRARFVARAETSRVRRRVPQGVPRIRADREAVSGIQSARSPPVRFRDRARGLLVAPDGKRVGRLANADVISVIDSRARDRRAADAGKERRLSGGYR